MIGLAATLQMLVLFCIKRKGVGLGFWGKVKGRIIGREGKQEQTQTWRGYRLYWRGKIMHVIKLQPCGGSFFGHPYRHLFSIILVITASYCKSNSSMSFHFIHVLQFHPMSNLFHLCHQINPKSQFNCLMNFIYIFVSFPCYQLHHVESSSLPSTSLHSSFPSICLFHLGLETHFIICILIFMFDPYV